MELGVEGKVCCGYGIALNISGGGERQFHASPVGRRPRTMGYKSRGGSHINNRTRAGKGNDVRGKSTGLGQVPAGTLVWMKF